MANYLLAYKGGSMAETPEAQEAAMQAWGEWFGTLGSAVVDMGAPFGASTAVQADGSTGTAGAGLSGYSVLQADSLELAAKLAGGCPVLSERRQRGGLRSHRDVTVRRRASRRAPVGLPAGAGRRVTRRRP